MDKSPNQASDPTPQIADEQNPAPEQAASSPYPRPLVVRMLRNVAFYWWSVPIGLYVAIVVTNLVIIIAQRGAGVLFNWQVVLQVSLVARIFGVLHPHWWLAAPFVIAGIAVIAGGIWLQKVSQLDRSREQAATVYQEIVSELKNLRPHIELIMTEWEAKWEERQNQLPGGLEYLKVIHIEDEEITALALAPNGLLLACGSLQGTITCYNIHDGEVIHILNGHSGKVHSLTWSPDGNILASAGHDGTIRAWDSASGTPVWVVEESGDAVLTLAWSPNRPILASGGADNAVRLWDSQDGASIAVLRAHSDWVRAVVWSPDGRLLASASEDKTVCIWRDLFAGNHSDIADGEMVVAADPLVLSGHSDWVRCLAWSPHGRLLASGSDDASIRVWDVGTSTCEQLLESRGGAVTSVAFAGKGMLLLAQTTRRDDAFQCWQVRTWQEIFSIPVSPSRVEIARNLDAIIAEFPDLVDTRIVDRSPADRLVEGAAYLGARNFGLGAIVTTALELSDDDPYFLGEDLGESGAYTKEVTDERALAVILDSALALNRAYAINYDRTLCYESLSDILVTWGKEAGELALWRVHAEQFAEIRTEPVTRYTNARAVLIGETGVGKTCLGRALMGEAFIPQESTAGRTVWVLQNETVPIEPLLSEEHELLLWDMPGQQGYRVVHQLYLDDVTVALLVFDSLDETGSFGEVYYWERALRQAQQLLGRTPRSQKVFLVAARVDRAGVGVSQERVDRIVSELHLDGFYRTSALEGTGIEELRQVIIQAVAWERILKVTSTELFHSIKQFLVREKEMGRLLSTVDDLYRAFTLTRTGIEETRGLRHDFDICVDRVAQVGLIQRFSWGNYVLLQPELLDAYTSALVTSARDEPDGLGSISKADVLAGSFAIPQDLRIRVPTEVEQSLLVAMVEELIRRDLALAQQTQKGEFLVFPAQTQRERPEFPDPRGQAVRYDFEGAVTNLYATLAVRLARSTIFTQPEIYRNAIQYTATSGGTCGLVLSNRGEGVASLTLFFGEETQAVTRVIFEEFVVDHLRTGLAVRREPIFRCSKPGCGLTTITPEVAQAIRAQGRTTATCHVCGTLIPLLESRERLNGPVTDEIAKLNTEIDKARNQEAWVMVRRATQNYDVFFSYNSTDSKAVKAIAKRLIEKGVMPWLYEWDQVGGKRFLPEIERAIQICRAGVYFEGDNGEGAWQEEEADALIRETKQRAGFSVIPVILPEASQVPEFPHFLKNRVRIDLRAGEDDALSALMQAITGLPIGLLEALRR